MWCSQEASDFKKATPRATKELPCVVIPNFQNGGLRGGQEETIKQISLEVAHSLSLQHYYAEKSRTLVVCLNHKIPPGSIDFHIMKTYRSQAKLCGNPKCTATPTFAGQGMIMLRRPVTFAAWTWVS